MRLNLLSVPTLITPAHPCVKKQQDMWITWLRFRPEIPSLWHRIQSESTAQLPAMHSGKFGACPLALLPCADCPAYRQVGIRDLTTLQSSEETKHLNGMPYAE
jgi:hypothetical protein